MARCSAREEGTKGGREEEEEGNNWNEPVSPRAAPMPNPGVRREALEKSRRCNHPAVVLLIKKRLSLGVALKRGGGRREGFRARHSLLRSFPLDQKSG